jgi:HepT-like protein
MKTVYIALIGRIKRVSQDLERVVKRAESLMDKAKYTGDDGYLDGVALNLHGFYAGVEKIFEDIARTLEKNIPDGSGWHQDLLLQMAAEISPIRPPVISEETRDCLGEYRGFRHVVRNVYTFNLQMSRLQDLTKGLQHCYVAVKSDLDDFMAFLKELSNDNNDNM